MYLSQFFAILDHSTSADNRHTNIGSYELANHEKVHKVKNKIKLGNSMRQANESEGQIEIGDKNKELEILNENIAKRYNTRFKFMCTSCKFSNLTYLEMFNIIIKFIELPTNSTMEIYVMKRVFLSEEQSELLSSNGTNLPNIDVKVINAKPKFDTPTKTLKTDIENDEATDISKARSNESNEKIEKNEVSTDHELNFDSITVNQIPETIKKENHKHKEDIKKEQDLNIKIEKNEEITEQEVNLEESNCNSNMPKKLPETIDGGNEAVNSSSEKATNDKSMEDNEIQKCDFCNEVFSNMDDIANHLVLYHVKDQEVIPEQNEQILSSEEKEPILIKVENSTKYEDGYEEEEGVEVVNDNKQSDAKNDIPEEQQEEENGCEITDDKSKTCNVRDPDQIVTSDERYQNWV